jgi:hypothetical protein
MFCDFTLGPEVETESKGESEYTIGSITEAEITGSTQDRADLRYQKNLVYTRKIKAIQKSIHI